ncbi:MAG: ketopantoate reductase family protein [Gammaproteobacteria bacterium]|nr:ketopantoate reductase family protein [Gammaproteobacteria bacterium]
MCDFYLPAAAIASSAGIGGMKNARPIRKACVVGAGAIGSLFAGHLGALVETSVLVRRQEHAEQLNKQGLRVSGKSDRQVEIKAATDAGALGDVDLVIIATKANVVERIAASMAGHFPNAIMMTVQNGLGCEALVARCGDWPIISAVTFMSGLRHSDVHVEYELDTETWMGPWAQGSADFKAVQAVAELIRRSGLKAKTFSSLLPAQWSKLIFNSVVNSVAALTDLPHVSAYAETESALDLGHLVRAMMEEGKAVAKARGVELHEDPWDMNVKAVSHGRTGGDEYAHVPSMLDDVRARRLTEIDWITGAVMREAAEVGIAVPIHETLYHLVKARESGWN